MQVLSISVSSVQWEYCGGKGAKLYSLNESLAFLLNRTGSAIAAAFSQELKSLGLTMPMWRVLAALWSNGDQSLNALSELACVEISTLSRQVASLVATGLVSRNRSAIDWRSINLGLTPPGRAIVEQLVPLVQHHEQVAFSGITATDARRLRQLLNKIHSNIQSLDKVLAVTARPSPPGT